MEKGKNDMKRMKESGTPKKGKTKTQEIEKDIESNGKGKKKERKSK